MKRLFLILLIFTLTAYLSGCDKTENIYGTYVFDDVMSFDLSSSSAPDDYIKKLEGTTYTLTKETYDVIYPKKPAYDYKREHITYKRKRMGKNEIKWIDICMPGRAHISSISEFKKKYMYTIYDDKGIVCTMLFLDNDVWLVGGSFVDKKSGKKLPYISYIYKLKLVE